MSPSRPFGRGGLNFFAPVRSLWSINWRGSPAAAVDFFHLDLQQWILAAFAAFALGLSKGGFGGLGMFTVIAMATIMRGHELQSTGVVLPLLIGGDLMAVLAFRRHANWRQLFRILPPALLGVCFGFWWMRGMSNAGFRPLIGWIVVGLAALQFLRQLFPRKFERVPHSPGFAWGMGIAAGVVTMLANAAGPIMSLYFLAVQLPKLQFVGTAACYFLIVNCFKVPFSANLGFIDGGSLFFNAVLLPVVALGVVSGRFLLHRVDQRLFERLMLALIALSALHLILF